MHSLYSKVLPGIPYLCSSSLTWRGVSPGTPRATPTSDTPNTARLGSGTLMGKGSEILSSLGKRRLFLPCLSRLWRQLGGGGVLMGGEGGLKGVQQ